MAGLLALLAVASAPDGGRQESTFENPVARFEGVARATPGEVMHVDAAFLAGNWSMLEAWAALGAKPPQARDTPHGKAVAALSALPLADRDAVIHYLMRARELERGFVNPVARHALPAPPAELSGWLLGYLAGFEKPEVAPVTQALGAWPRPSATTPDEPLVALAGDLGLAAAAPHLLRFVKAPRRFFQLFTDYSTSPEEKSHLFETSLWALTKLAPGDASIPASLEALRARLSKPPDPMRVLRGPGDESSFVEPMVFERQYEERGGGGASAAFEEAAGREEFTKRPLVDASLEVIRGKRKAPPVFDVVGKRLAEALWVRPFDALPEPWKNPLFGPPVIAEGKLIALEGTTLSAVELATGDRTFEVVLQGSPQVLLNGFTVDAARGALLAPVFIQRFIHPPGDAVLSFDLNDGALRREARLWDNLGPPDPPLPAARAGDALALLVGPRTVVVGPDGKVRRELAFRATASAAVGNTFAFVHGDELDAFSSAGASLWHKSIAELATVPLQYDVQLARAGDLLLLSGQGPTGTLCLGLGPDGAVRWNTLVSKEGNPVRLFADGFAIKRDKELVVYGLDGKLKAKLAAPAEIFQFTLDDKSVYALADYKVWGFDLATGKRKQLLKEQMNPDLRFIGAFEHSVLVQLYMGDLSPLGRAFVARIPFR